MTDLSDLINRVRVATGPDRELDCAIFCATAESPFQNYYPDCVMASQGGFAARVEISDIPKFSGSIDAAAALCECVIPNFHRWTVGYGNGETFAYVDWRDGDEDNWDRCTTRPAPAPTAPLALTLAVLLAKQEIEQ